MQEGGLGARQARAITIEQLFALNEEIRALVRAGVPLERGLLVAARDLRGRLGRITGALAGRLNRGESLVQALEAEKQVLPPLYRAVVEAGARSGQLPVALEGLAQYVRGYSEARATVGLALWYPLVVLSLAYLLFVGLVLVIVPRFLRAFESLGLSSPAALRWLSVAGKSADYWWLAGPIALLLLAIAWVRSGAAARFQSASWTWLKLFPWMRSILTNYEGANFCELLALLLEHEVTFPEALELAAESTGNPRLLRRRARPLASDRERSIRIWGARDNRPSGVPADAALGPGDGAGAGLASACVAKPRRALPQACQVSGREALGVLTDVHHGGDRGERNLVLRTCTFPPDHQPAGSTFH